MHVLSSYCQGYCNFSRSGKIVRTKNKDTIVKCPNKKAILLFCGTQKSLFIHINAIYFSLGRVSWGHFLSPVDTFARVKKCSV